MSVRRNRAHTEPRLYDLRLLECWKNEPGPFKKLRAERILGSGKVLRKPFVDGVVVQQDVAGTVGANVDARCMHEVSQRLARDGDPHEQSWEYVERQLSPDHLRHGGGFRARGVDRDVGVNRIIVL